MAVLDFVNVDALDENMLTLVVCMDLSKAIDTIDHNILLHKLYHYGFRGKSHTWFKNYLSDGKQLFFFFLKYINNQGQCSSNKKVVCGVPHGSILGPLLFIIYKNDFVIHLNCYH